jgi:hypothetical protein
MKLNSNWMQQTLWEADIRSTSQEIPLVLCNPKVIYLDHRILQKRDFFLTEVDVWGTEVLPLFPLQQKSDTRKVKKKH